jgi:hypothetical protein
MAKPPGSEAPPLVQGLRYASDPLGFLSRQQRRYGDVFSVRFPFFGRVVYVARPDLVKSVFTGAPSVFHAGEANATVLEPALGPNSVLTLDDEPHMRQRKLLLPPFHGERIQRYGELMVAMTRREMERWPVGEPFALRPHTQRITLAVIMRAVFGVHDEGRLRRFERLIDDFARRVGVITSFPMLRRNLGPASPWPRFVRSREALDEFIFEEIRMRRAEPGHEERDDVLSLLLGARDEDGEPMSDEELRDELVTVLGAGHETTADRARLGGRAAGAQSRGAGAAARAAGGGGRGVPERDGEGDAAGAAGDRRRRPQADRARHGRRLRARRRHLRPAGDRRPPLPRRPLPRAGPVPPRALPRRKG